MRVIPFDWLVRVDHKNRIAHILEWMIGSIQWRNTEHCIFCSTDNGNFENKKLLFWWEIITVFKSSNFFSLFPRTHEQYEILMKLYILSAKGQAKKLCFKRFMKRCHFSVRCLFEDSTNEGNVVNVSSETNYKLVLWEQTHISYMRFKRRFTLMSSYYFLLTMWWKTWML